MHGGEEQQVMLSYGFVRKQSERKATFGEEREEQLLLIVSFQKTKNLKIDSALTFSLLPQVISSSKYRLHL